MSFLYRVGSFFFWRGEFERSTLRSCEDIGDRSDLKVKGSIGHIFFSLSVVYFRKFPSDCSRDND